MGLVVFGYWLISSHLLLKSSACCKAGSHTHHTKTYQGARKGAKCKIRACFQSASISIVLSQGPLLLNSCLFPAFNHLNFPGATSGFPLSFPISLQVSFPVLDPYVLAFSDVLYFPFPFSSQFTFSRSYFHASMATSLPVTSSFIFHTLISSSYLVVL